EGPSEGVEQGLPDGPGELSFGHDASPVSGPVGFGTTWQVPTRRRCFSIRYARSVVVEFFVETTDYWQAIRRDPDDDKFVDAAVAGNAEWIVTEDSDFDDLVADTRLLVRALNPRDFIDLLRRHG
ncbi:MAG: PIN domain-containing protein, partial [Isosphaeraceae bacterium]